jgi:transposase
MGNRREFSVEYKKEIIKLVTDQGKKVTHVAKDIGVSEAAVRRWVKEYGVHGEDAFPGKGKLRPEDEEIRKMKKRMADLEEENAILKKAICIFTKPEK